MDLEGVWVSTAESGAIAGASSSGVARSRLISATSASLSGSGARAKALGAYGAVLGLASVAGPLLGGVLVEADLFGLGWRAIFWVNVPVAIIG